MAQLPILGRRQDQRGGGATAPIQYITQNFVMQSYFDSSILNGRGALLVQPVNEAIVPSTARDEFISGYGLGLHPASKCPVAVAFKAGAGGGSSTVVLTPGQIIRPGGGVPPFTSFRWGLPFGWLGGGTATLAVFRDPSASIYWTGNPEVIFHRMRIALVADAGSLGDPGANWPIAFPWVNAVRAADAIAQGSVANLAVEGTRILLRLRSEITTNMDVRFIVWRTSEFDTGGTAGDTVTAGEGAFYDVVFQANTYTTGSSTDAAPERFSTVEITGALAALGGPSARMRLARLAGAAGSPDCDIIRMGRL